MYNFSKLLFVLVLTAFFLIIGCVPEGGGLEIPVATEGETPAVEPEVATAIAEAVQATLIAQGVSATLTASASEGTQPTIPTAATYTPVPPTPAPSVIRSSTFDGVDMEGWFATDKAKLTNPGAGGSGGGPQNGCLIFHDVGEGAAYYVAPPKFLGDWRGYSKIKFDIWSSGGDYFSSWPSDPTMREDIFLASGRATAQRLLPQRPPQSWETFVILLIDDGKWTFHGGATSLNDILANVTDFRIRAEYGVGEDESGLDNVELVR